MRSGGVTRSSALGGQREELPCAGLVPWRELVAAREAALAIDDDDFPLDGLIGAMEEGRAIAAVAG